MRTQIDVQAKARAGPRRSMPWYAAPLPVVLDRCMTQPQGISEAEARIRLAAGGPNRIAPLRPVSAWRVLLSRFDSVALLLLVVAAPLGLATGDLRVSGAIVVVVVVNVLIGFVGELRASRAPDPGSRRRMKEASVIRDGQSRRVPARQLVPGDVIEVREGERVPADARLLESSGVRVRQAALTGDPTPVEKAVDPVPDPGTPLAEQTSMLFAGTWVTAGSARAVVTSTGVDTEIGKMGRLAVEPAGGDAPLDRRLEVLGRRLVWFALAVSVLVTAVAFTRGAALGRMLETGTALAIAAIPEGLPAVIALTLALGLRRMAQRKARVYRLDTIRALDAATVFCTDKTGTLTVGEMTAVRLVTPTREVSVSGRGFRTEGRFTVDGVLLDGKGGALPLDLEVLLQAAALAPPGGSQGEPSHGDPTDAALRVLARKGGVAPGGTAVAELPFSSDTRASASFHRKGQAVTAYVKGAPSVLLERSRSVMGLRGPEALTPAYRKRLEAGNRDMAEAGLRVIALAMDRQPSSPHVLPGNLVLLGLVGMWDPPAEGVAATIRSLDGAGVRTVVLTGDQTATAQAVARAVGIPAEDERVVSARDMELLDDAALTAAAGRASIFSRVRPEEKARIVKALRAGGQVVAMMADPRDDSAALELADVSVRAATRGPPLAGEVPDLTLEDDGLSTMAAAVEEGRVISDNIRKVVFYLFSCSVAEVLMVMIASLAGLALPVLPMQLLWLNVLIIPLAALALAVEPGEPFVMWRPPRGLEMSLLSWRFTLSMSLFAVLITAATLGAYLLALSNGAGPRAITVAFMTLALAQLFHLENARRRDRMVDAAWVAPNRWALGAVALGGVLQLLALYMPPLSRILGTTRLELGDWAMILPLAIVPAVLGQLLFGRFASDKGVSSVSALESGP